MQLTKVSNNISQVLLWSKLRTVPSSVARGERMFCICTSNQHDRASSVVHAVKDQSKKFRNISQTIIVNQQVSLRGNT